MLRAAGPVSCATAGCRAALRGITESYDFPPVSASILAVTGTGQSVGISALSSARTMASGGFALAELETSDTDLADLADLGAGA